MVGFRKSQCLLPTLKPVNLLGLAKMLGWRDQSGRFSSNASSVWPTCTNSCGRGIGASAVWRSSKVTDMSIRNKATYRWCISLCFQCVLDIFGLYDLQPEVIFWLLLITDWLFSWFFVQQSRLDFHCAHQTYAPMHQPKTNVHSISRQEERLWCISII